MKASGGSLKMFDKVDIHINIECSPHHHAVPNTFLDSCDVDKNRFYIKRKNY